MALVGPVPKNATFHTVAAGTLPGTCKGLAMGGCCTASIYWAKNEASGRRMPIDCDVEGGVRPSSYANDPTQQGLFGDEPAAHDGRGISHFFTCVDADLFSKNR